MKVLCGSCQKKETGRAWKLQKNGWLIIWIRGADKVVRCPVCKVNKENWKKELTEKFKDLKFINNL